MKFKNYFKRSLTVVMAAIMFVALSVVSFKATPASAATEAIDLYASDYHDEAGGGVNWVVGNVYIKVSNRGQYYSPISTKKVYLHGTTSETGSWTDTEATYVGTLADGSLIYKARTDKNFSSTPYAKFALKYVVNGNTYWDNNYGQDYTHKNALGSAVVKAHTYANEAASNSVGGYMDVYATVKNLAYTKDIKVVYTTNNWATTKKAPLNYQFTNDDGSEEWKVDDSVSVPYNAKFYIQYKVNGQTYIDNNFGNYYSIM